ncbi:MAG: type II secretion system protein [Candidatus Aureabacteria bacterium]|nr:type II secretion system protein [Candidatus Auribacterota bacterium]
MKTKQKQGNTPEAFTLIELLVAVGIVVLLVGLFLSAQQGSSDNAKIVKTRYILNKITEGIKAYESDWGALPSRTCFLVSNDGVLAEANARGITLTNPREYISGLPTALYNELSCISNKWYCPVYLNKSAANWASHACQKANNSHGCYFYSGIPAYQHPGGTDALVFKSEWWISLSNLISYAADAWNNMIYYTRIYDANNNIVGYVLISPGPDGKTSYDSNKDTWTMGKGTYTPNSSAPEDKDNIILAS